MVGRIIVITLIGLLLLFLFVPSVRNFGGRFPTTSEQITIRETKVGDPTRVTERSLELVTLLGFDAIHAILDPELVTAQQAEAWLEKGTCRRGGGEPCARFVDARGCPLCYRGGGSSIPTLSATVRRLRTVPSGRGIPCLIRSWYTLSSGSPGTSISSEPSALGRAFRASMRLSTCSL